MKKLVGALLFSTLPLFAQANSCPDVLKFMKRKLNSQETVNLCSEYQGKTLLIVNTASYCGFTPQFEGLEAMYDELKDDDFVVLGFPSHDFNQEDDDEGRETDAEQGLLLADRDDGRLGVDGVDDPRQEEFERFACRVLGPKSAAIVGTRGEQHVAHVPSMHLLGGHGPPRDGAHPSRVH